MRRGFALYASELVAFAAALGVAFLLFRPVGGALHRVLAIPEGLAGFGCFVALLVAGHGVALALLQRRLNRFWAAVSRQIPTERAAEVARAAGAVPALGTAVVLSSLVLSALVAMPQTGGRSL